MKRIKRVDKLWGCVRIDAATRKLLLCPMLPVDPPTGVARSLVLEFPRNCEQTIFSEFSWLFPCFRKTYLITRVKNFQSFLKCLHHLPEVSNINFQQVFSEYLTFNPISFGTIYIHQNSREKTFQHHFQHDEFFGVPWRSTTFCEKSPLHPSRCYPLLMMAGTLGSSVMFLCRFWRLHPWKSSILILLISMVVWHFDTVVIWLFDVVCITCSKCSKQPQQPAPFNGIHEESG